MQARAIAVRPSGPGRNRFAAGIAVFSSAALLSVALGQAVGPTLEGAVQGTAGITVEQSLLLGPADPDNDVVHANASNNGLVVVSDDGSRFAAAVEMHVGDTGTYLQLAIKNHANMPASSTLRLTIPEGIDVEVGTSGANESSSSLRVARTGPGEWLLRTEPENEENLMIRLEPRDAVAPGFFTITADFAPNPV